MGYKAWIIAKWNKHRAENAPEYKQMKDRDMTGVEVIFTKSPRNDYYYKDIIQPSDKITMTYIANLGGRKGCNKYWTNHGYGGWIQYITFNQSEFDRMKAEVERLGGKVILKE